MRIQFDSISRALICRLCRCPGTSDTSDELPDGTYHANYTGACVMENEQGEVVIGPDEFGYVPDKNSPPTILSNDPGFGLNQLSSNVFQNEGGAGEDGDECVVGQ